MLNIKEMPSCGNPKQIGGKSKKGPKFKKNKTNKKARKIQKKKMTKKRKVLDLLEGVRKSVQRGRRSKSVRRGRKSVRRGRKSVTRKSFKGKSVRRGRKSFKRKRTRRMRGGSGRTSSEQSEPSSAESQPEAAEDEKQPGPQPAPRPVSPAKDSGPATLPPGWEIKTSKSKRPGVQYYWHKPTGRSRWKFPSLDDGEKMEQASKKKVSKEVSKKKSPDFDDVQRRHLGRPGHQVYLTAPKRR